MLRAIDQEAADDANEASQDSTDDNPSNGQDAPVPSDDEDDDGTPTTRRALFEIRLVGG